ncbi:VOC family protein [Pseudoruegeria sp. HB172150]|uniref:VOC family protein n=1 Tax=Pseudoruegeria sp. HB172150 TaxID=2721164 RepID=UPI001555A777|nr:VOC family protein [Pseudoruegeria sp. HB172150]
MSALTPYIIVKDAARAIAFYTAAFGAEEDFRMTDPGDGRIGHAELKLGDSVLMLADEYPDFGALSPDTVGGTPVTLHLQVDDVDALVAMAELAGATILRRPADQSFGERNAQVQDPFGHRWMVAQVIEEVTPAEMQRRWEAETSA